MKEMKRYFSYIGKYKRTYWAIFICTIISSMFLDLMKSFTNKFIFNAIEYKNEEMFARAVIFCIILLVVTSAYPYYRYFQIRVVRKIVFDIKLKLFDKLLKMNMKYFETTHSGEALKVLNQDANSLKDSYFSHVYWVIGGLSEGLISIAAMLAFSPILGIISLVFCFVTAFISVRINKNIKLSDKEIQGVVARLTSRIVDILDGFIILKMYPGASLVRKDCLNITDEIFEEEKRRSTTLSSLGMVTFLLSILANFGTIAVGSYMVHLGKMDYGTIMAIVSLQMGASQFMKNFGKNVSTMSTSLVKAGRVFDFLEMNGEERENTSTLMVEENAILISIQKLNFAYDEALVLKDFSLDVEKGEKLMIMGESGCGKSTLIKLLLGFYEAMGEIKIQGKNIKEYPLKDLRKNITYIPQESYLFEGTIRENIAYGLEKETSMTEIENAAKLAYADEFINKLPQGYETQIEAGGTNLSGGQRQRIAIARAFLKNSSIILMDEPTSALDAKSEQKISEAIDKLMQGKTVIMITHQTTAREKFDRVVTM